MTAQSIERSLRRAKRKADAFVAYQKAVTEGSQTLADRYGFHRPGNIVVVENELIQPSMEQKKELTMNILASPSMDDDFQNSTEEHTPDASDNV